MYIISCTLPDRSTIKDLEYTDEFTTTTMTPTNTQEITTSTSAEDHTIIDTGERKLF